MSLWKRLFQGKEKPTPKEERPWRDIPQGMLESPVTLACDPGATDPERRFTVGSWGLRVSGDEESQRLARGVLKRNAGKTLRLEPFAEASHRGVIPTKPTEGSGYGWISVEADLRAGTINFQRGQS
jgi:hypothetical protein